MKRILLLLSLVLATTISFGQFTDTAALRSYIRDTIKDRRPEKVTAAQIQKAMLGTSKFLNPNLQAVTNAGKKTKDTIYSKGIGTNVIKPDTLNENYYTIIILPDLQNMIRGLDGVATTAMSRAMFKMIKDSATAWNIKFVGQVGDLTDWNTQPEWDTLNAQWSLLDSTGIPYISCLGNHDYGTGFNPAGRDATKFDASFGPRYLTKPWYKGNFGNMRNFYISFEIGSKKYLAISLEFLPTDAALTWAGGICDSVYAIDKEREVMIFTHSYLTYHGQLNSTDDASYGMSADNNGKEMWDKLISKKPNIKWVFAGHAIAPGWAKRGFNQKIFSAGDYGNMVNQIYVNYQDDSLHGGGWLMRARVYPATNKIDVDFYSPYHNRYDNTVNPPYEIGDENIEIPASISMRGDLGVNKTARFQTALKLPFLTAGRLPYVSIDGSIRDTSAYRYDTAAARIKFAPLGLDFTDKYGNNKITIGGKDSVDYITVTDKFGRPSLSSKALVDIQRTMDSASKLTKGYGLRVLASWEPKDSYTNPTSIEGGAIQGRYGIRVPKGEWSFFGSEDFPWASIYGALNLGGQEDSAHITFYGGTGGKEGGWSFVARNDLASPANIYGNITGPIGSYVSMWKISRKAGSLIDPIYHFLATSPAGSSILGTYKSVTGLHVKPQNVSANIIRPYGIYQEGATDYNVFFGTTLYGDSAITNIPSGVKLYVNGKIGLNTGSNASIGTATLASGTVTVSTTAVATGSIIYVVYNTPSGTQGFLSVPSASIVNGTSFVINSSSGTDNSTVNWWIVN